MLVDRAHLKDRRINRVGVVMRRIVPKAIILLLLGATINVAVAWICVLRWRSLKLELAGNLESSSEDSQWLRKYKWPEPDSFTFISHKHSSAFGWLDDQYTISFKPYDPATTAGLWRTR